jgi:glutathione synthase
MVTAAFVMDPLDQINLKKDSTLAMIRAAQLRGWDVNYLLQSDLFYRDHKTWGYLRTLRLSAAFVEQLAPSAAGLGWYETGSPRAMALESCDIVFMRKDPPFDMNYIYTTYLLERLEDQGVLVSNRPASLRDCNEKFFATAFPEYCPPLVITSSAAVIREFQASQGDIIVKRLDGMGGASVFRVMKGDPNFSVIVETLTRHGQEPIMAQRYLPEISEGDKRILLVDGVAVPYALARIPKAGEVRGNLAAGGTGKGQGLTRRDQEIAERVGPEVARRGLHFVGIDVIGDYLTEVNVTCPTCIRELDAQFSLDIGAMLLDKLEDKLQQR